MKSHIVMNLFKNMLFLILLIAVGMMSRPAFALEKISFMTDWRAEAEQGGFYQAKVDGTYARFGLDVTILQGSPQTNNLLLLSAKKIDFSIASNIISVLNAAQNNIPITAVAAIFQKDPVVLLSHPNVGLDKFQDLTKATAYVATGGLNSFYLWLKKAHGFRAEKTKLYNFNSAPFIADNRSIQQGILTSEPFIIQKNSNFTPNVFLLSDYGYGSYGSIIETRNDLIKKNPDLVQRFVDASIIGWYNYLYGDNSAANEALKKDNSEMTNEQIAYAIKVMKEKGIVDSGDASKLGIGVITDDHFHRFVTTMKESGVVPQTADFSNSYTTKFTGKEIGRRQN